MLTNCVFVKRVDRVFFFLFAVIKSQSNDFPFKKGNGSARDDYFLCDFVQLLNIFLKIKKTISRDFKK